MVHCGSCHPRPAAEAVCLLQGFGQRTGLRCLFGLQWVSFETRKKVTASRRDITGSPDIYTERRSAMNAEISVTEVVEIFAGDYLRRYDL